MPYAAVATLTDGSTQRITYDEINQYELDRDLISSAATNVTIGSKVAKLYSTNAIPMPYLSSFDLGSGCPLWLGYGALANIDCQVEVGDRVNRVDGYNIFTTPNILVTSRNLGYFRCYSDESRPGAPPAYADLDIEINGNGYTSASTEPPYPLPPVDRQVNLTIGNGVQTLDLGSFYLNGKNTAYPSGIQIPSSVKVLKCSNSALNPVTLTGGNGVVDLRSGSAFVGRPVFIGGGIHPQEGASVNLSKALIIQNAFGGNNNLYPTSSVHFNSKIIAVGENAFNRRGSYYTGGLSGTLTCNALYIGDYAFHCNYNLTGAVFDISNRKNRYTWIGDYVLGTKNDSETIKGQIHSVTIKGYEYVGNVLVSDGGSDGHDPNVPCSVNIEGNGYTQIDSLQISSWVSSFKVGSGVTSVTISAYGSENTVYDFGEDVEYVEDLSHSSGSRGTLIFRRATPPSEVSYGDVFLKKSEVIKVPSASVDLYKSRWTAVASKITSI